MSCFGLIASVFAQQHPPSDTEDFKTSQHFDGAKKLSTISSFRQKTPNGPTHLTYDICNLSSKPLLAKWDKPGFETGITHPIPCEHCAVFERDVDQSVPENDAPVEYNQHSTKYPAAAFLPKETWGQMLLRTATTRLSEKGIGSGPMSPSIWAMEVVVQQVDNYGLQHKVTWRAPAKSVVLWLPTTDEKALSEIARQLQGQGGRGISLIPARDFISKLSKAEQESLPSAMREGMVMWFATSRELNEVKFIYSLRPPYKGTAPILMLDEKLQIIWMARYTTACGE